MPTLILRFSNLSGLLLALICNLAFGHDCSTADTQRQINRCADAQLQAAQSVLDQHLNLYQSLVSDSQAELLHQTQQAWEEYRDAHCALLASGVEGGSAYSMVVALCKTDMTKQRVNALAAQMNCEEGDLSCLVPFSGSHAPAWEP